MAGIKPSLTSETDWRVTNACPIPSREPTRQDHPQIKDFAADEKIPYSHILIDEDGFAGGVVDQLQGVKGFMGGSTPVPTRTALRRQMLPTPNLTIEGKRRLSAFQNLKTQCAFKFALAELVETEDKRKRLFARAWAPRL
jgi:hypothetical protein